MKIKEISVLNHRLSRKCIALSFHAHWRRISDSFLAYNYFRIAFIVINVERVMYDELFSVSSRLV